MGKHLDWKLDFKDQNLSQQYKEAIKFQGILIYRSLIISLTGGLFLFPLLPNLWALKWDNEATINLAYASIPLMCSYLVGIVIFYSPLITLATPFFATYAFALCACMTVMIKIFFFNTPFDNPYSIGIMWWSLIVTVGVRGSIKISFPPMIILNIFNAVLVIAKNDANINLDLRVQGCVVSFYILIIGMLVGYFLERQCRMDFASSVDMQNAAEKLSNAIAKDVSILQNIFPKNISNELQGQLSAIPTLMSRTSRNSNNTNNTNTYPSLSLPFVLPLPTPTSPRSNPFEPSQIVPLGISPRGSLTPNPGNPIINSISQPATKNSIFKEISMNPIIPSTSTPNPVMQVSPRAASTIRGVVPLFILPNLVTQSTSNTNFVAPVLSNSPTVHPLYISTSKNSFNSSFSKLFYPQTPTFTSPLPHDLVTPMQTPATPFHIPPVTPSTPTFADGMPPRFLTTSGRALNTQHESEMQTFYTGTQHADGSIIALSHAYPDVTVVLADIVGFTSLSSSISPQDLVSLLNKIFSMFDVITTEYQLEKIRTIGDAYLCVANMSVPLSNHQHKAIEAAHQMLISISTLNLKHGYNLNLRVGISSGPLIGGVTGLMKWNYDIFGKPLTDATLMETSSEPGTISVTSTVYKACSDHPHFAFERSDVLQDKETTIERYIPKFIEESQSELNMMMRTISNPKYIEPEVNESMIAPWAIDFTEDGSEVDMVEKDAPLLEGDNPMAQFPYEAEDLQAEVEAIGKPFSLRRLEFKHNALEKEYWKYILEHSSGKNRIFWTFFSFYLFLNGFTADPADLQSPSSTYTITYYDMTEFILFGLVIIYVLAMSIWKKDSWIPISNAVLISFFCATQVMAIYFRYSVQLMQTLLTFLIFAAYVWVNRYLLICFVALNIICAPAPIINPHDKFTTILFVLPIFVPVFTFLYRTEFEISYRRHFIYKKKINFDLVQQKQTQKRSSHLLQNILPLEILPRLQGSSSNRIVNYFEEATIMFVNITNLTRLTEPLEAAETFNMYNWIFTQFDEVARAYNIEKIKTVNSVYMIASGLPRASKNHAQEALNLALELYRIASKFSSPLFKERLTVRAGIATGPVVAGIIGTTKYAYDCWSDTTNTASRMESNSFNGFVQVTPHTRSLIGGEFNFQKREKVFVKGKGYMETYLLNMADHTPNKG